jgi:hypothetical protein
VTGAPPGRPLESPAESPAGSPAPGGIVAAVVRAAPAAARLCRRPPWPEPDEETRPRDAAGLEVSPGPLP